MATDATVEVDLFIGGKSLPGRSGARATVVDPATNHPLAQVAVGGTDDADQAMEVAQSAWESSWWASDDGGRRAKVLFRLAQLLEAQSDAFAELETRNMGKTLRESKGDILFTVRTVEYMAGLADKIQGETIPVPGNRLDYTLREPLGVTVHISPWNYPLLLAIRSVAPALAAGNAVVLKPATLTPLTALRFAALAREAGLPDGILNVVVGPGREVGEALIRNPRCRSVSFTGSGEVGNRVAELAASRMVPMTLELGGKSPVIVFPDADLDRAAKAIGWGIFGNAGQMCWAASRLIVHESVHDALLGKVSAIAAGLKVGPGLAAGSEMGPLVSRDQLERVLGFLSGARDSGARFVQGGHRYEAAPLADGNFLAPTVLDAVPEEAPVWREEVFGPVLSTRSFQTPEEAVALANGTPFGLFAALWTREVGNAHSIARRLEAGMVTVNEAPVTFPQTPFGAYKGSGIGFEQGRGAVEQYTRRKNILINLGPSPRK
ncbi:MAG TPA: aldehyde dehydrogenase family protein [Thermoplasmata archaeon]|nr:aldehyde dehydrogenase family protein [Thermoplasmata archaeon]